MLTLLLPMLVILGHDIIPHHHHNEEFSNTLAESLSHSHTLVHGQCEARSSHSHSQLAHSHQSEGHSCCHFNQNRLQKVVKYQVVLATTTFQHQEEEPLILNKYSVQDSSPYNIPDLTSKSLRAPPVA